MEPRRRRRTTDPAEAARCIATGLAEIAEYAEGIGDGDSARMRNNLQRLEHQLGNMTCIIRDYMTVIDNARGPFREPLEFDVWGEDEREQQHVESA